MSMASGLVQHVLEMLLVLGTRTNGDETFRYTFLVWLEKQ
jgi:hypothetical protein